MISAKDYIAIDFLPGMRGLFSTRRGGESPTPFDSLNLSFGVGDAAELVVQNRCRVKKTLGISRLLSARQVHGDHILSIVEQPQTDEEYDGYDSLITNQLGVGIMVQQADCQAVVLYDPLKRVVANVHVGWRGSVAKILNKTMQRLCTDFGTDPRTVLAAISPSLGPCCAQFTNFQTELPPEFHPFQIQPAYFDFWAITQHQLEASGVLPAHIRNARMCTRCNPNFFSFRREGVTGRSATVVVLQ